MKHMETSVKVIREVLEAAANLSIDNKRTIIAGFDEDLGWICRDADDPLVDRLSHVTKFDRDGMMEYPEDYR